MNNRRVTIIGGAGFIGRNIVKRLSKRGAVIAVASPHAVRAGFLRPMGDVGQITPIDVSVAEEATLAQLVAGSDTVIYTAGTMNGARMDLVHHRGPARLARLATRAGVRSFVHVSALGAAPHSPAEYARSKAAGEAAVLTEFPAATVLRPSLVFGPDDNLFNRFAALARFAPVLPLIGGGQTKFQPVFVGDVADAAVAALDRPEAAGKVYELGGPEILTFRQLMDLLLKETRRRRLLLPVPAAFATPAAYFLEFLPDPPLTRDQVALLQIDNIVTEGMSDLPELGIVPTALDLILPTYLDRFRKGGRFAPVAASP